MSFLQTYGKEIFSLLIPLLTWALNNFFKAKARLLRSSPHGFTFIVQQPLKNDKEEVISPTQSVHTTSHVIHNVGRDTATKLELVFNWKPLCINIWPSRHYIEHLEPDGRYIMVFDSLAPREVIGCELLSINASLPDLITVRSDQCTAQIIEMYAQPAIKGWQRKLGAILVLSGFSALIYAVILLLQFLIVQTPLGH